MVETPVDPIRMPTVTLSEEELDGIEAQMAAGELPPDFLDRHYEAVRQNVFGVGYRTDGRGNPIEQGFGAPGNQTRNSINAYKKWNSSDHDFSENLKRMESELAACNKLRAAGVDARRNRAGAGARR